MDTISQNSAPVGSDDVTSSPETASQVDTQTSPTSQPVDGGAEGNEGKATEALLAGKYKSPQDLEKAYKELEAKLGQTSQKAAIANQIEQATGMNSSQIAAYLQQQENARLQKEYQDNPMAYTTQKVQELEAKLMLQDEERELDSFIQKNPEYSPYRDKLLNLGLNLEREKSYEDIATDYFGHARAQGQQDAYKKIEVKKTTQATGVQSAPKKTLSEDDLRSMSVAELRSILPKAPVRE